MHIGDFDYLLPRDLIAQTPTEPRDHSRLLVLDRHEELLCHYQFYQLPDILRSGDLLVFNDSRVIPARLYGHRIDTGGHVELLLIRREATSVWQCLARPSRRLRPGIRIVFAKGLEARVLNIGMNGIHEVMLSDETLVERVGLVALPHYIHTPLKDPSRYQTVYAGLTEDKKGSVAAPTAGLHFTDALMHRLEAAGIELAFVTLHVGLDTFRPVEEDDPRMHELHSEFWELSTETAAAINRARLDGRRIVAVGTTSVRALEQAALVAERQGRNGVSPGGGWADLFILPGHPFRVIDAMITNFHLPRSTLLMLVSAFAGRKRILEVYSQAVVQKYHFYSFGDSMLIL
ncbi:tRNA preQ1(34) S-adenosylmethionine ribosyltransferase-isomerase QueA [Dehalococcoidia bacterium]|nr:tRNA preQ1(34) S-adenosylmethionine ribosyltransferase-isomerase QueA [Dehalococcoidia bacterium]